MKKLFVAVFTLFSICAHQVYAQNNSMPAPAIPKEFATLKQLLGTWHGENQMGEQKVNMTVHYKLTSGGTAITETLMAGTPQEMVTVYHKDGDSVALTHYCMLGNQPHMKLTQASNKELSFVLHGKQGITSAKEPHMGAVKVRLLDDNTLEQQWQHFVDGKLVSTSVFTFTRET